MIKINSEKNEIIVGPKEELGKTEISLKEINLLADNKDLSQNIYVKVRSTFASRSLPVDLTLTNKF